MSFEASRLANRTTQKLRAYDPGHDLVVLFYMNMYQRAPLYPEFLSRVYQSLGAPAP